MSFEISLQSEGFSFAAEYFASKALCMFAKYVFPGCTD